MIVKDKDQKMIGVRMDIIELDMLNHLQKKMKMKNLSQTIRQLIREVYCGTAENKKINKAVI
jgi:hypothetical protein